MSILLILVPAALLLGVLGLLAFFWAVNADQFDDPDGAARRILADDKPAGAQSNLNAPLHSDDDLRA